MQQDESAAISNVSEPSYEEFAVGNGGISGDDSTMPLVLASQQGGSSSEELARQTNAHFVIDNIPCAPSEGTTLTGPASGVAHFGHTNHEKSNPWHSGAFNDYLPLPDPTFPFTSLGFTNSLNYFDPDQTSVPVVGSADGAQTWRSDISDMAMFGSNPNALPALDSGGDGSLATLMDAGTSRRTSSRPAFAVSPPLLSPAQEDMLLAFFERDIRPPASLVGVDPLGWLKIKRYVLRMARDDNESVMHALFALSTLLSASSLPIRLGTNRDDHRLFASRLQEAACAAIEVGLMNEDWAARSSHALLVSVFLLAWFEVRTQLCLR